jgi:hypothetical protein
MFAPVMNSRGKFTGAMVSATSLKACEEQIQWFQKWWVQTVRELLRGQRETVEAQFEASQQYIEKAFQIGEARSAEEVRARTLELWQKGFETVRQVSEAQARDFTVAIKKWGELISGLGVPADHASEANSKGTTPPAPSPSHPGEQKPSGESPTAVELEKLKRLAAERISQGFAPPREIYQVPYRSQIDWSTFPDWARPSDPELFEGCSHEG